MICTFCGREGHTAARCKVRPAKAIAYIARLLAIAYTVALAACSQTPPAEIKYVTVTERAPAPVLAGECYADDPAEPKLKSGTALDIAKFIEEGKAARRVLVKLRRVCRASLTAHFGTPGKGR